MLPKQKVYQGVLQEIRKLIDSNELTPGDKLPSERDLAEKLQAGRSSIREALRAMELLGLIETRHGEGTYLSTYRPYQTVELLASFILQDGKTKNDLTMAKRIIEKEAAKIAYNRLTMTDVDRLNEISEGTFTSLNEKHAAFFNYLFDKTENELLATIWRLMEEFSNTIKKQTYDPKFYSELVNFYKTHDYNRIEKLFMNILREEDE